MCNAVRLILSFLFSFLILECSGQEYWQIDTITYSGHKRTKLSVFNIENPLSAQDTILKSELSEKVDFSKKQLLSTGLFNQVEVALDTLDGQSIALNYNINENWYLFPAPVFELADRNFNVWWQEFDSRLDRTVYGVRAAHYHTTGRRDRARIILHTGYIRKAELTYDLPNVFGKHWGFGANLFYSDRKEIGYKTEGNKTLFYQADDERVLLQRFRAGVRMLHRPNTFLDQVFRLEFHQNTIDDFVAQELNPDYFLNGSTRLRFFLVEYDLQFDKTDSRLFPQQGFKLIFNVKKEGLFLFDEIDNLWLLGGGEYYYSPAKRISVGHRLQARTNLSRSQIPFSNNTGLGWSDFHLIGYDLYVMDGPDFLIAKNHLAFDVFNKEFQLMDWLPSQFSVMPVQIFIRLHTDFGYTHEPTYISTNSLNNQWVLGYGPSLDLILYHNYLFTFEYGFNTLGERGLFLKNSIAF